ncbi:hypothetical protein JMM81_10630 [Bacillus sp. V3B]|uniref:hypothetical protein n=1 Tax=Bacillus sp. V3B TaxID=2804915 RepID=UPI00210BF7CA|nr:hypothetical protein [Bacillus sp. V3B]MCQ6275414.1 hypothetical protein [Bacillus sp. V3B]
MNMDITIADIKKEYTEGYKALQVEWKKKDKELVLVGRLAYWVYWLSKLAEGSNNLEERKQLFTLKKNGLILLLKSDYVSVRKYIPKFHKKLCYSHYAQMKKANMNTHLYLYKRHEWFESCPNCQKGKDHYFSLFSIAVLDEKEDSHGRTLLFLMNTPYLIAKDDLPDLDSLERVKKYYGNERCTVDIDKHVYQLNTQAFSSEIVFKYFSKNYESLSEYLRVQV